MYIHTPWKIYSWNMIKALLMGTDKLSPCIPDKTGSLYFQIQLTCALGSRIFCILGETHFTITSHPFDNDQNDSIVTGDF